MHSFFQDKVGKFFFPYLESAMRHAFIALFVYLIQHLAALIV